MSPKPKPKHDLAAFSMISWRCLCGGTWRNDTLKKAGCDGRRVQKTDEELGIERDEAFAAHLIEMKKAGF